MRKTLSILLVLVMLLSLYACSNSDSQTTDPSNSSQATTEGTENPTDGTEGTTGTTQSPTDEPTTPLTDEPTTSPTDEPTTLPTQAPTDEPTTPPTTQPTTCSHSWKNATCTAPKTCSKCGVSEGNAAGHSWKDATCTAPKTCSKCGATEGNSIGHNWRNASCTTPKTCSICKITDGTKTEHKYANGKCSFCEKEDLVNPQEYFTPANYVSLEERDQSLSVILLIWHGEEYELADTLYVKTDGDPNNFIDYKGERYYASGGASPSFTYRLTDTYVEFIDPGDEPIAKYALQHDGSLRLITNEGWTLPSLFYKGTLDELLSKLN